MNVVGPAEAKPKNIFWIEMNRREQWDRDYEKRVSAAKQASRTSLLVNVRDTKASLARLEREKVAEVLARGEWDLRRMASHQVQLLAKG